jgi:hypothetical protein
MQFMVGLDIIFKADGSSDSTSNTCSIYKVLVLLRFKSNGEAKISQNN